VLAYIGVLRYVFGKKRLEKKSADLQPKQGNLLHRNNFTRVYKTFTAPNRVELDLKISSNMLPLV
jgi:hypothetical protein